jgi:hypothetical protein
MSMNKSELSKTFREFLKNLYFCLFRIENFTSQKKIPCLFIAELRGYIR